MIAKEDWYNEFVEEGVRDVVKLLRNNGINTVSSCHHDMTVHAQYIIDGQLQDIHNLLYNHFMGTGEEVSFEIIVHHTVEKGYITDSFAEIKLKRPQVDNVNDSQM